MEQEYLLYLKNLINEECLPITESLTEIKLYQALDRLIAGKPVNSLKPSKLNLSAIHREAKLSNGVINYYPEFKAIAIKAIAHFKNQVEVDNETEEISQALLNEVNLKKELKKQINLKNKYRIERDAQKSALDNVITREAELLFRLYELQNHINNNQHANVVDLPSENN
jgi:hypothetical protein